MEGFEVQMKFFFWYGQKTDHLDQIDLPEGKHLTDFFSGLSN